MVRPGIEAANFNGDGGGGGWGDIMLTPLNYFR